MNILRSHNFIMRYLHALVPIRQFPRNPRHEEIDDTLLPLGGDGDPARHFPPLREAIATATGAGVLGFEHRVPAHRRLLAIVRRVRRSEARSDEVLAMAPNRLDAFFGDVLPIRFR